MNISYTAKHHLCLGCGLCEDICPSKSITISIDNGEYRAQVNDSSCLGEKCGRCGKICPGLGVNLKELSRKVTDINDAKENVIIGRYTNLYTGHSKYEDIRFHSASGGLVTGLLIYLIEKNIINGAVVTKFSSVDNITPEVFIARTKEEIISARSSKYCPVSMHGIRKQIREAEGQYVIVGLPCHLHGFRKIEEIDRLFSEHVYAYFGLYCSSGRTFHLTDYVLQQRKIDKRNIRYFAYRDEGCLGSLVVRYLSQTKKSAEVSSAPHISTFDFEEVSKERFGSYYNLRSFFIPRRCHFCIDHSAELSDISFGDIHIKPYLDDKVGLNSVIVRNAKMNELLRQAVKDGAIILEELQETTLISSQKMARVKKTKYASLVCWGKKMGMKVPEYDVSPQRRIGFMKSMLYMLNLIAQYMIGHYKSLWPLIKYTIKK